MAANKSYCRSYIDDYSNQNNKDNFRNKSESTARPIGISWGAYLQHAHVVHTTFYRYNMLDDWVGINDGASPF